MGDEKPPIPFITKNAGNFEQELLVLVLSSVDGPKVSAAASLTDDELRVYSVLKGCFKASQPLIAIFDAATKQSIINAILVLKTLYKILQKS